MTDKSKLAEILLIEDNEGDIVLTREAFENARFRNTIHVVEDGAKALDYLFKRNGYEEAKTPDIILLDLNLPKVDGREVLEKIKQSATTRRIPTIVLTSSMADRDVIESYDLHANCYIVKPVNAEKFMQVIHHVGDFWIDVVCLPTE